MLTNKLLDRWVYLSQCCSTSERLLSVMLVGKKQSWRQWLITDWLGFCLQSLWRGYPAWARQRGQGARCGSSRGELCVQEHLTHLATSLTHCTNVLQAEELDFSVIWIQCNSHGTQTVLRMWGWAGLSLMGKKPFPQAETLSLTCGAKQAHINSCFFLDDVNFAFTGKCFWV